MEEVEFLDQVRPELVFGLCLIIGHNVVEPPVGFHFEQRLILEVADVESIP